MAGSSLDNELLGQAERLRQQAEQLVAQLLSCFDNDMSPTVVGSVAMDLMTKRDIDIACCIQPLEAARLLEVGQRITAKLPVGRLTYVNPSVVPWHDYKKGLFCGLQLQAASGETWNSDVWAYDRQDFESALAEHELLARRLREIDRWTLLRLKCSCAVQSHIIYTAVLEHGVRTVEELADYVRNHEG